MRYHHAVPGSEETGLMCRVLSCDLFIGVNMGRSGIIRRATGTALVSAMVVSGLLVGSAQPAGAAQNWDTVTRSSWAYTDSLSPHRSFGNSTDDAPVGAWRDTAGKHHISKSYFTFDLSAFRGARIFSARAFVAETAANDCSKPRATELWATDAAQVPTWAEQPQERAILPIRAAEPRCTGWVSWDATDVVRQAAAADDATVSLALRIAEAHQGDVAYGRRYANNVAITVYFNRPPNTPTNLRLDIYPCTGDPIYTAARRPGLSAQITDPDPEPPGDLAATFAIWPLELPSQRTELTVTDAPGALVIVPDGLLIDGGSYAFAVRASDEYDTSAWTQPCQFSTDFTAPPVAPTVSSPDYPADGNWHGGAGIPGTFTFTANGVEDVTGFYYNGTYVAADRLGGSATVSYAPQSSGPNALFVSSVDRAGHRSPEYIHHFYVQATEPLITIAPMIGVGIPEPFGLAPRMADVVSYTYRVDDGPETTIAAGPDGTATGTAVAPTLGTHTLYAWSTTSTGLRSGTARQTLRTNNAPLVTSDVYPMHGSGGGPGIPGTFFLTPRTLNVVEYSYTFFEDWENIVTVPAAPDGTASFIYTPSEPGFYDMNVWSRSADGTSSNITFYDFDVNPTP
jgi:hypothetical protein